MFPEKPYKSPAEFLEPVSKMRMGREEPVRIPEMDKVPNLLNACFSGRTDSVKHLRKIIFSFRFLHFAPAYSFADGIDVELSQQSVISVYTEIVLGFFQEVYSLAMAVDVISTFKTSDEIAFKKCFLQHDVPDFWFPVKRINPKHS